MKLIIDENTMKDWNIKTRISCIYKVTNIKSNKVYIGQTQNFRSRASDYANAITKCDSYKGTGMYSIIKDEGIENFTIEILERVEPEELNIKEKYYIQLYDAMNPEKGYNQLAGIHKTYSSTHEAKSLAHLGLKESNDTKRKKSNTVIAISDDYVNSEYPVIIADSAKLFGDWIGYGKDYVKNCLRGPIKIKGYHIYYFDYFKRNGIIDKIPFDKYEFRKEYLKHGKFLNNISDESVETIYLLLQDYYKSLYFLKYENISNNKPCLELYTGRA